MTDPLDGFDLDNPNLPKAIKKHAMASGDYPYEDKLDSDSYEEQMYALQKQLVLLQAHLAKSGDRIMIVFEGRDAAGKGGTIRSRCGSSPRSTSKPSTSGMPIRTRPTSC